MSEKNTPSEQINSGGSPETRFIPIPLWERYHPWPSEKGLRFLVFNERENGFSRCIVRVGTRVLIDEREFIEWVRSHRKEDRS